MNIQVGEENDATVLCAVARPRCGKRGRKCKREKVIGRITARNVCVGQKRATASRVARSRVALQRAGKGRNAQQQRRGGVAKSACAPQEAKMPLKSCKRVPAATPQRNTCCNGVRAASSTTINVRKMRKICGTAILLCAYNGSLLSSSQPALSTNHNETVNQIKVMSCHGAQVRWWYTNAYNNNNNVNAGTIGNIHTCKQNAITSCRRTPQMANETINYNKNVHKRSKTRQKARNVNRPTPQ